MSRLTLRSETCPNCKKPLLVAAPGTAQLCESCRTLIVPLQVTQRKAAPPKPVPVLSGPLLTGNTGLDSVFGVSSEIAGFGLILYAVSVYYRGMFGHGGTFASILLTILGTLATAALLFRYADTMRQRYPFFQHGWQRGRDTWGHGVEHLITFSFGVGVLIVCFPITMAIADLARAGGSVVWLFAGGLAYLVGLLVRRLSSPVKGDKTM